MTNPRYSTAPSPKGIWQFSWEVVKKVVSLLFSNLFHYLVLYFLALSPAIVIAVLTSSNPGQGQAVASFLSILCGLVVWAAITYSALQHLQGNPASSIVSLKKGLQKAVPIAITYILFALIVGLGFLFFIIPGFILLSGLLLAIPIVVFEDLGPIEALKRSWNLSHGYKKAILNAAILLGILSFLCFILFFILIIAGAFVLFSILPPIVAVIFLVSMYLLAMFALQVSYPLAAVVFYYQIRKEKEGIGLEELLKVFE